MQFKERTLDQIADMICGNFDAFCQYRSSSYLTEFFRDCDTDYCHDGSTRRYWVAGTLSEILAEPQPNANTPPDSFARVIRVLMDQSDAVNEGPERPGALALLNTALAREGFEAFYAPDRQCYLRHIATNTIATPSPNPHRPFSASEIKRPEQLLAYMERASEDELIEEVLLPLFRQLGFHRVTAAGHKDKALEYGKDVWMKYTLPTQHILYFGIQAKKGKLDAAGVSKGSNVNVAEVHAQVTMMLGHEIFDPETNRRVLVDHAFIVAGGEITKAARNSSAQLRSLRSLQPVPRKDAHSACTPATRREAGLQRCADSPAEMRTGRGIAVERGSKKQTGGLGETRKRTARSKIGRFGPAVSLSQQ